jgi:hypothetical protein
MPSTHRANLGKLVGLHGHDSGHGRIDPPPPMTVFLGERLIAGASGIAGSSSDRMPFSDNEQGGLAGALSFPYGLTSD